MAEENSPEIVKEQSESVAATNLKALGDGPAFYQNQAYAISNAAVNRMNVLAETAVAKSIENLQHACGCMENAVATSTIKASDLGPLIAQLMAAVAGSQQAVKGAQSTPPETGGS